MEVAVEVIGLAKAYGRLQVLEDWNVVLRPHERVALLGPSGAGKTTFLRLIAGLERPDAGIVRVHPARIGFVFQEPRLIPWQPVQANLDLVRAAGTPPRLLELLGLTGFTGYMPEQLSGGMRQRVNFARALLMEPELLLLDEPFVSWDWSLKITLMNELLRRWQEQPFTLLLVTHDCKEALCLADRILLLGSRPAHILHEFPATLSATQRSPGDSGLLQMEAELMRLITA